MAPVRFFLFFIAVMIGSAADELPIVFTGRLLGYFRMPDQQLWSTRTCPAANADTLTQVIALKKEIDTLGGEYRQRLLLGLGDNFSPDLASRFLYQNGTPMVPVRKDVAAFDGDHWVDTRVTDVSEGTRRKEAEGLSTIPVDNVACFLKFAGYDALVPGKHDFYFGPERLRQLAKLLAQPPDRPTMMLGANLWISSTPVAPQKPGSRGTLKADLPDAVYPWIRRFAIPEAYDGADDSAKAALQNFSPRAVILSASESALKVLDGGESYTIPIRVGIAKPCVDSSSSGCGGGVLLAVDWSAMIGRHPDRSLVYRLDGSIPWLTAKTHQLCAPEKGECLAFDVQRPFFQYPDAMMDTAEVKPYLVKTVAGQKVAVFGVVDPSLKESIGLLNYAWINVDRKLNVDPAVDTQLQISDPVAALDQVLDACEADTRCEGARKVVLAQMHYDKAQLLAGGFRKRGVEVVLAETDDRHAAADEQRTQEEGAPVVLSPSGIYDSSSPNQLRVRAYKAVVGHVTVGDQKRLSLDVMSNRAANKVSIATKKPDYGPGTRLDFGVAALQAMRGRFNADLAILQKRDLFDLPATLLDARQPINNQQAIDAVLWKGDFVVRVDVTGDTLKAALDQSKAFDAADSNSLGADLEAGRGLLTLGIVQDAEKNWLVNGQIVDGGKLYSVAMTDYLAFGDTGYPGLKSANLPRAAKLKRLTPLSELVCRQVFPHDTSCGKDDLTAAVYFDRTAAQPNSNVPATPFDDLDKWYRNSALLLHPKKPLENAEEKVQNHRLWTVTLEKADLTYASYDHTPQSQKQLKSEFAGVPQTSILTANSWALGHDFRIRVVRSGKHVERFLLAEDAYERDYKQSDADVRIQSQPFNLIGLESGLAWRLRPFLRALPAIKLTASVRAESNFAHPLTAFALKSGGTLVQPIDKLTRFPLKLGMRMENRVSWLEFGYQFSRNWHSPTGYEFFDPNTGLSESCPATLAQQSLSSCIGSSTNITLDSMVHETTTTRNQAGLYLNFKIQVPLYSFGATGVSYVMENTGNLYRPVQPEYSLDPRYLETWTHSLNFKLPFANLSLVPKLIYVFYKNMVDRNTMRSTATSVSLQYNFAWHSGMKWGDALRFQDPSLKPSK